VRRKPATTVETVPTTYHRRPTLCTHCGDAVFVVEAQIGKLFGLNLLRAAKMRLEHADPGPGSEACDAGCLNLSWPQRGGGRFQRTSQQGRVRTLPVSAPALLAPKL
jgi:hypothetical protein